MNMRKLLLVLLVFVCITILTTSLQLSRGQQNHYLINNKQSHLYYGKHSRSQRSHQYVEKVKNDNLDFINQFNDNNKKALKTNRGLLGSSGSTANAFSMAPNKFIQFSEQEFNHLFKGLISKSSHHDHQLQASDKILHQQQTKNHQVSIARLLLSHQSMNDIQAHYQDVVLHDTQPMQHKSQYNSQHDGIVASLLGYQNPYEVDKNKVKSMYGSTNSDSNWGWDWKKMDTNYYKNYGTNFFKNWQDDHWGFDVKNIPNVNVWDSIWSGSGSKVPTTPSSNNNWWSNWDTQQKKNTNNSKWWDSVVDWWNTPSKPVKPVGPVSPVNPVGPVAPVKPVGPVSPFSPSNNNNPSNNVIVSKTKLEPYASNAVEVNWALRGGTTHIKNQGQCGSCWSFAALGALESFYVIKGYGVFDFSQQMLVDCQKQSYGCQGGNVDPSYDYIIKNGILTEDKYPYRGLNQRCAHQTGSYKISKYVSVRGRNSMQQYLRLGPLAGAIAASGKTFQFYSTGIFDKCASTRLDHAIVIVGFTSNYWIVRNSWGDDWGQQGHMRLKRSQNNNNACGIQSESFAITA